MSNRRRDTVEKIEIADGIELVKFSNGEANIRHVCRRGRDSRQIRISSLFNPEDRLQIECPHCRLSGEIVNGKFYYA
ncbi:hypothetical protein HWD32_gp78 [Gordonia phage Secretariat]|uniref:Uncharacterized protein n=1 Tax=Gordonia phage Secretariat TaxID=2725616 RepID=A0A6M3SUP4_9CAUD|nr:hypothetical protein HWD32_gp78 [Gordonia phage Secretariat]QJD49653.1 hypothetical protein SEA_SECRETARIAT_78 [Gordonia phage Secretariat]